MNISIINNPDASEIAVLIMQTIADKIIEHKNSLERSEVRTCCFSDIGRDEDVHRFIWNSSVYIFSGESDDEGQTQILLENLDRNISHHSDSNSVQTLGNKYAIVVTTLGEDDSRNISQLVYDKLKKWNIGTLYRYDIPIDVEEAIDIPLEVRKTIEKDIMEAAEEVAKSHSM